MKLLGLLAILAIGGYVAWTRVRREQRALALADAWLALLGEIRNKIDCFSLPLDHILRQADPALIATLGIRDGTCTLPRLLERTRAELPEDYARTLDGLIGELGKSYRAEQVKRCDYYLKELEKLRDRMHEALPGRIRLSVTLSVCAALGTVILIW